MRDDRPDSDDVLRDEARRLGWPEGYAHEESGNRDDSE